MRGAGVNRKWSWVPLLGALGTSLGLLIGIVTGQVPMGILIGLLMGQAAGFCMVFWKR